MTSNCHRLAKDPLSKCTCRDELLNGGGYYTLREEKVGIESRTRYYNRLAPVRTQGGFESLELQRRHCKDGDEARIGYIVPGPVCRDSVSERLEDTGGGWVA